MKRMRLYGVATLATVIAGCFGPGSVNRIPLTMPGGEKATIVAHNQQVPDYMLSPSKVALNFIVKGNVSEKQLAAVAAVEDACRVYTNDVTPSDLVAVVSGGVVYGIAGFIGVGAGSQAFAGASFVEYGMYGAAAGGLGGMANAFISNRAGRTYTFQNCGREALDLFSQYKVRVLQKSPW